MYKISFTIMTLFFSFAVGLSTPCPAADYPTRSINVLIGYAPGGTTDLSVRTIANEASRILGKPMICNNVPGAAGTLVLGRVKGEKPDGYTVFSCPTATLSRIPHLQTVPYEPLKDFSFIMNYALIQYGLVVRSDSPWKTFEEFIDYAKNNPNKIKYATAGVGTGQHLVMEYLSSKLGIKWDHVPFPGGVQAVTALLGGHVQAVSQSLEWKEQARAGKLRPLVIWTDQRSLSFPDVPTLKEKGYPFALVTGFSFIGPAGMPKDVVQKLQDAFHKAMEYKPFLEALDKFDLEPHYMDSENLEKFVRKLYQEEGDLIKSLGLGIYKKQ